LRCKPPTKKERYASLTAEAFRRWLRFSPSERPARRRPRACVLGSHVPEVVGVRLAKAAVVVPVLVAAVVAVRASGLGELLSLENLGLLREYIGGFGALAPLAYCWPTPTAPPTPTR
jgi:hypothetical protein